MAKLVWDKAGERLYETGVNHGVLYPLNSFSNTYDSGVVWNGLTQVSESPDGAEATDLWADNIKYASLRSAETFGATIEAYTYPEEFAECDGSAISASGVYVGQQQRKKFGFCYRTEVGSDTVSDTTNSYKLHLVYGCTASPSDKSYETINDSPDAITFSWEIDTVPVEVTGLKPCSTIVIDSNKCDPTALSTLEDILYGSNDTTARLPMPDEVIGIMSGTVDYSISNFLSNVTNDNAATSIAANGEYVAHLTAAADHTIANVIVTMGGVDVTATKYSAGTVTIASVTGNVVITATANHD